MYTWTSSPETFLAALVGAAIVLTATLAQAAPTGVPSAPSRNRTEVPIQGETVVIAAPPGYCVDDLASLHGEHGAFVLMAACRHRLEDVPHAADGTTGLLTATVDGRPARGLAQGEVAKFLASHGGRRTLSRSGDPEAVNVDTLYSRFGVVYLHAHDRGVGPAMGGESWRAVFSVNGRMVTATLRDFAGQPIPRGEGFRTLEDFVDRILKESDRAE